MDWYPLWNSLRIAAISTFFIFFYRRFCRILHRKAPAPEQGRAGRDSDASAGAAADGRRLSAAAAGAGAEARNWRAGAGNIRRQDGHDVVVGDFRHGDCDFPAIFWRIRMPYCRQGILAGAVLAFARALGEYGATSMIAGYTPGKTATISTTVYQMRRTDNDALALKWVMVNMAISAAVLLTVNMLERRNSRRKERA